MNANTVQAGLEGVTVAETRLSDIDGEAGELVIAGFPVEELARNATYEETVFLLLEDRLPSAGELTRFRSDLASRRELCEQAHAVVRRAAEDGEPAMDALRMGLAAASLDADTDTSRETAERVVAVIPTIVAAYWRYRQGEAPVAPDPELGHAANYLAMLTGDEPVDHAVRGLETYLNTVVDHGLNASTFTARTVVMGFGHRVYRVRDPRAEVLSTAARRFYETAGETDFYDTVAEFESVALDLLADHKPDRRLATNVEFYTAALLHGVGIPRAVFTPTFAVARAGGWMAHGLEQLEDNRLVRPVSRYTGAKDRSWTPVAER